MTGRAGPVSRRRALRRPATSETSSRARVTVRHAPRRDDGGEGRERRRQQRLFTRSVESVNEYRRSTVRKSKGSRRLMAMPPPSPTVHSCVSDPEVKVIRGILFAEKVQSGVGMKDNSLNWVIRRGVTRGGSSEKRLTGGPLYA